MDKKLVKSTSIFFYFLLLLVGAAAFVVVQPYLTTIVLAILTVLIFRKPYERILSILHGRKGPATVITILLVFISLIVPMALLFSMIAGQSVTFVTELQGLIKNEPQFIRVLIQDLNRNLQLLPVPVAGIDQAAVMDGLRNIIQPVGSFALRNLAAIGGQTLQFLTATIVYIMLLASLFPNQRELKDFFLRISPFDRETNLLYFRRIIAMCESMIIGTVVIALIQGLIAAVTLAIAGVPYVLFWFMLYVFLSIVPLGGGLILFPIGIFLILTGNVWQGILVLVSQLLVISNIDNILRPRIVSKEINLDPAILLIGVLGGISVFGFFGIIYGPVILIFLQTTIEIYMKYYQLQSRNKLKSP
ncbi:MAG: AI-2E family transporter [Patescibacteria group bacterium]|nr:AI-2E family transporter [Patescibacteria group bacterium]